MVPHPLTPNLQAYLKGRIERANIILFTGAGFSQDAKTREGEPILSTSKLKESLWNLCFPGETYDPNSSLQHLYDHALLRHQRQLSTLLVKSFTVDPDSLPDYYRMLFCVPWLRIYTLNIDDLAIAVGRKFPLPRKISPISVTARDGKHLPLDEESNALRIIHLNGMIEDVPTNVTFSLQQYAVRLAQPDPAYTRLAADLISNAVVFVGTNLDEPSLWQHIEARRLRGPRSARELRPRSFLIAPTLDRAREALLEEYHITWIPLTAEQFASDIILHMQDAVSSGQKVIVERHRAATTGTSALLEVADLAQNPSQPSEFLLGQEPIWADLQSERAIERECDKNLWSHVIRMLDDRKIARVLAVTGTAGSGKSTSLMRLALRLSAERGCRVAWVDREIELSPRQLREAMLKETSPPVLAIDDADMYGGQVSSLAREITTSANAPIILIALRSSKVDRVLNPSLLQGVTIIEEAMPYLSDNDIDGLIDLLAKHNRLGVLRGKSKVECHRIFRQLAGRQLLVAMIEATSGKRFEQKIVEEFEDLSDLAKRMYATVAVATVFRFRLTKDEVLFSTDAISNEALNQLEQLIQRKLILCDASDGGLRLRHRRIAEILVEELQKNALLSDVLPGLTLLGTTKVSPELSRSSRPWRLLISLINHDFLGRALGLEGARNLYGGIEGALSWDYQYWLQRGSLEVEHGSINLAENFLNQARALNDSDAYVRTEWAYLLFKKAIESPRSAQARALIDEAKDILEDLILARGSFDSYPYHVLGSQGLSWSRRGYTTGTQRQEFLRTLVRKIENGVRQHPRNEELAHLLGDLKRELMMTAVSPERGEAGSA